MSGQYLLLDSESPMIGPLVGCKRLEGKITVSGMVDGDLVRILGLSAGVENGGVTLKENGEHTIDLASREFIRAVREGAAGRVSVRVR